MWQHKPTDMVADFTDILEDLIGILQDLTDILEMKLLVWFVSDGWLQEAPAYCWLP